MGVAAVACSILDIAQPTVMADAKAHAKAAGVRLQVKRESVGATIQKQALPAGEESSDTDGCVPFFTVPHLYADVSLTGPAISEFPILSTSLLDIGCPSTVISDELSNKGATKMHGICEIKNIVEGRKLDIAHHTR
ncbi:hypothetical protein BDP27DRAFT_1435798 [Rhodocollybia butyracea]|uniref:Uncharacterized protein n=1 Tax=Rhodocollybia butyracea TaxID=206335 RepID=A0A9P5P5Q7_9AGAR|nr:hypothetical protein BDP27DRAFT_1435798 [Rhodocollybia butyracea]